MILGLEKDSCIQTVYAEVTDNSIDIIICFLIIEYIFYTEYFAGEISRIGRIGATFIATFPALRSLSKTSQGRNPSDKIRRYWRRVEIEDWAKLGGPG